MATATIDNRAQIDPRSVDEPVVRAGSVGLRTAGILAIVISAWAAIVPYIGPTFGYAANGTGSWFWSLSHSLLALVPGAIGIFMGFAIVASSSEVGRGRFSLAAAGLILLICGAWVAIGPLSWTVIYGGPGYFAAATPFREFTYQVGSAIGPGLIMAGCGAFAMGWASRHQRRVSTPAGAAWQGAPAVAAPVAPATAGQYGNGEYAPGQNAPGPDPRVADAAPFAAPAPTTSGTAVYPSGAEPVVAAPPSAPAPPVESAAQQQPFTGAEAAERAPAATAPQPPAEPAATPPPGSPKPGATPNRPSRPPMATHGSPAPRRQPPTMARPEPGRAESGRDAAVEGSGRHHAEREAVVALDPDRLDDRGLDARVRSQ